MIEVLSDEDGGMQAGIPLKKVIIKGQICGLFGEFQLSQAYKNESAEGTEVIYTFPLPDNAVVTGFTAQIGDRLIKSEIREREEAFEIYDKAIRNKMRAYLMEEYRPNIFQVSLGQVLPEDDVRIEISYLVELKYVDSELRVLIPTLVAPRYIPGNPAVRKKGMGRSQPTDRVPDADFITPPVGAADYTVELDLTLDPLLPLAGITSPSHDIKVEAIDKNLQRVTLLNGNTLLDRDIIIVAKCLEEAAAGGAAYQSSEGDWTVYMNFLPDLSTFEDRTAREYIFLLDISGSMSGVKLQQAKTALQLCIRNLTEKDDFNIVAFESGCHYFSRQESLPFNQDNLDKATGWINKLHSMGGTEILRAVKYSFEGLSEKEKVVLLFTDGEVGNEAEVIEYVNMHAGKGRLFPFGIDTAVNTYLINGLAEAGRGLAEYIYPGERIDDKVLRQFARINSPSVTDIVVDWGSLSPTEVFPHKVAAIFDLELLTLLGSFKGDLSGEVYIKGNVNGEEFHTGLSLNSLKTGAGLAFLEKFWVKKKINDLEASLVNINPRRASGIQREIIELAKKYGVNSSYTSYVAVDEREDCTPGVPKTVVVPVRKPALWLDSICLGFSHSSSSIRHFAKSSKSLRMFSSDLFVGKLRGGVTAEKPDMLRELALVQKADGSFCEGVEEKKAEITAVGLLAFLHDESDITIYKKQLEKSASFLIEFISNRLDMTWDMEPGNNRALVLSAIALQAALEKAVIRGRMKITASQAVAGVKKHIDSLPSNDSFRVALPLLQTGGGIINGDVMEVISKILGGDIKTLLEETLKSSS